MRDYKYKSVYLNYTGYLVPIEICTLELERAICAYKTKGENMPTDEFTWTFAEREAFTEMLANENTIILR